MKRWHLYAITFSIICGAINAQSIKYKAHTSHKKINDTVYLKRDKQEYSYQAVFIERDRNSAYYRMLLNFNIQLQDRDFYRQHLKEINKYKFTGTNLKGQRPFNTSGKYLPLYLYRNKLYLYYPCDLMAVGRRMFTDTTTISWADEVYPERLKSYRQINDSTVLYSKYCIADYYKVHTDTLKLLDYKNKLIQIKEAKAAKGDVLLYVPFEFAKNFDMIINKCEGEKGLEFDFDKISDANLLKLVHNYN